MNIHKTHSKKDILSILQSLNILVDHKLSKREIIELLPKIIENAEYTKSIPHLTALKDLFISPSLKKRLSVEKKNLVMIKSKKIINFATNNFDMIQIGYSNPHEVHNDALFIHHYGDIPTVRRALKLYNTYNMKVGHINPIISLDIQHTLLEKEKIKEMKNPKFGYRTGKFILKFN